MTNEPVRVLVIEDEFALCEALVAYLNIEGMQAHGAGSLTQAQAWLDGHSPHVLLLDLGLPDGDGLDWLSQRQDLRDKGVIITSARSDSLSRVSGIRAGADVYLVKPVLPEEVVSLIQNLMRRLRPHPAEGWLLDGKSWRLLAPGGQALKLTHSEHVLLLRLAQASGQPVSKEELVLSLGHAPEQYDYRRLEILIRRLRNKAEDAWGQPLPLETAHRRGYSFAASIRVSAS